MGALRVVVCRAEALELADLLAVAGRAAVLRTVAVGVFLAGAALCVVVAGPLAHARAPMANMAVKVATLMIGKQCTRKQT